MTCRAGWRASPARHSGEFAAAIAFLPSDAANYISEIALPVDGGKSVQMYLPS